MEGEPANIIKQLRELVGGKSKLMLERHGRLMLEKYWKRQTFSFGFEGVFIRVIWVKNGEIISLEIRIKS